MNRVAQVVLVAMMLLLLVVSTSSGQAEDERSDIFLPLLNRSVVTPTATPTPVPTPGVAALSNSSSYTDTIGGIWIVGEVENTLPTNVSAVRVDVNLYDGDAVVGTDYGLVLVDVMKPGERACFVVLVPGAPPGWTRYMASVTAYEVGGSESAGLTVLDVTGAYSSDPPRYDVTGQIRNDDGATATSVNAVMTLYDSQGLVLDCDNGFVSGDGSELGAGQTATFALLFNRFGERYQNVASYRVRAEGVP